ncbi:MAG: hypothetical protein HRT72_01660 [Flavobacteriales bacterium]|nr:hypothetical protein [Flavobacteriales bacterium]
MSTKTIDKKDVSTEEKLKALLDLQTIDSQIDKIRTIRGELPLEVQDLEDAVEGLETRLNNQTSAEEELKTKISDKENAIKDAHADIKRYETQQKKVRNSREFDSINKEIEFQTLEIQLAEKKIKEIKFEIDSRGEGVDGSKKELKELRDDLKVKKGELDDIVAETQKDEESLAKRSKKASNIIEDRLLTAYRRIRGNAINGLAVVTIQRDSCGGCFNKIPPQRRLDIRMHKKVIVCEHCGRVLVDEYINGGAPEVVVEEKVPAKKAKATKAAKK